MAMVNMNLIGVFVTKLLLYGLYKRWRAAAAETETAETAAQPKT